MVTRNNNVFSSQSLPHNDYEMFHSLLNIITPPQLRKSDLLLTRAESHCSHFYFGWEWKEPSSLHFFIAENAEQLCAMQCWVLLTGCSQTSTCRWAMDTNPCSVVPCQASETWGCQKSAEVSNGPPSPWVQNRSECFHSSNSPFCQALKWQSEVGTVSITLGNSLFFPLALYA